MFTGAHGSFKLEFSSSSYSDVVGLVMNWLEGVGGDGVGFPDKLGVPRMLVSFSVIKLQILLMRVMMLGDSRRVEMLSGM